VATAPLALDPIEEAALLIQITEQGRTLADEATKHLDTAFSTPPGLPQQLQALFSVIRDIRREAGDFV
jgi:hypothetical protein